MLEEAMAALLSNRVLDSWTAEVVPATSEHIGTWTVLKDGAGDSAKVRAKIWFEERANGVHLMFRLSVRSATAGSKILKNGWDPSVALAVVVGLLAAAALPDDTIVPMVGKNDLVPNGSLPKDRCVRRIVRRIAADVKRRHGLTITHPPEVTYPPQVTDVVSKLESQFERVPGRRVQKALGQARFAVRDLVKLGVPFQALKDLWDEETVRSVQES